MIIHKGFCLSANLGYACIVHQFSTLPAKKRITTNRTMVQKTFKQRGIKYASELALLNVQDLYKILQWNTKNNISFYRMSSDMFPWASEYGIYNLPNIEEISKILTKCGDWAKNNNQRLTFHPGPFNKLTSSNERVTKNTIKDLTVHADILDIMGLSRSHYNKINIHVGATYKNKPMAIAQFLKNFDSLEDKIKTRFTLENDDKASLYTTQELYDSVYKHTKIPIVFDYHHHIFQTGDLTEEQALSLAVSTWPKDIIPVVHYSESKALHEENTKLKPQAHSDYITTIPNTYNMGVDIMVEAKAKDKAIMPFI